MYLPVFHLLLLVSKAELKQKKKNLFMFQNAYILSVISNSKKRTYFGGDVSSGTREILLTYCHVLSFEGRNGLLFVYCTYAKIIFGSQKEEYAI